MATLHLVSHASALASCLEVALDGDVILLIGEASSRAAHDQSRPLLVLTGNSVPASIGKNVQLIDQQAFVELAVSHQPSVTWRASRGAPPPRRR